MTAFTCHNARVSFELYLDGMLPPATAEALEQHLFDCPACALAVGEDIQLGEAIEEISRNNPVTAANPSRAPAWEGWRYVAAASVLLLVGVAAGHFITASGRGDPRDGNRDATSRGTSAELVPLSPDDEAIGGFASFTDTDLQEAEREGLKNRIGRTEYRARRSEAELDLVKSLLDGPVTPERVVARLADRVRQTPPPPPPRDPRDPRDEHRRPGGGSLMHQMRVAMMILRRDPQRAFEPVSDWVQKAKTPFERQTAVKLLADLRLSQAHDILAAEVREGPARDPALDGLLALRDPRSHDLFASLLDDVRLPLDPTRIKAAGGLHRLGDPRGLKFLLDTFKDRDTPSDLRTQILVHVGSNPVPAAAAALPALLDGVQLRPTERAFIAEWLALSGLADNDPSLMRLMESDRDHRGDRGLVPVTSGKP